MQKGYTQLLAEITTSYPCTNLGGYMSDFPAFLELRNQIPRRPWRCQVINTHWHLLTDAIRHQWLQCVALCQCDLSLQRPRQAHTGKLLRQCRASHGKAPETWAMLNSGLPSPLYKYVECPHFRPGSNTTGLRNRVLAVFILR